MDLAILVLCKRGEKQARAVPARWPVTHCLTVSDACPRIVALDRTGVLPGDDTDE